MPCHTAVGIHNNFSSSKAAVAHGAANNELPGRVNVVLGLGGQPLCREDVFNDLSLDEIAQRFLVNVRRVLC